MERFLSSLCPQFRHKCITTKLAHARRLYTDHKLSWSQDDYCLLWNKIFHWPSHRIKLIVPVVLQQTVAIQAVQLVYRHIYFISQQTVTYTVTALIVPETYCITVQLVCIATYSCESKRFSGYGRQPFT